MTNAVDSGPIAAHVEQAAQLAPSDAAQAPEGWKLVPVEPTEEMIDAAREVAIDWADGFPRHAEGYVAMLAAAPVCAAVALTAEENEERINALVASIPEDIRRDLERVDWTPEEALRWYADGKHFDVFNLRTRILDTGAIASCALKRTNAEYHAMKGADASFPFEAAQPDERAVCDVLHELPRFESAMRTAFDYTPDRIDFGDSVPHAEETYAHVRDSDRFMGWCMAVQARATAPQAEALTDEQRDTLKLAIGYIGSSARQDRHAHIARIRALLAAQLSTETVDKPVQSAVDTERYRWLRERAWYVDAATYAFELRERWIHDAPPCDADDVERALDAARAAAEKELSIGERQ